MIKNALAVANLRPTHPKALTSLREDHRRVTRDRLIAAAEQLFQQNGYRATTIEQLVKVAGTTATTFYRHFGSKSELVAVLQGQLSVEVLAVLRKLEAVRMPTRRSVRTWVDQYFEMWRRLHVLCEAYWEAVAADPELAAQSLPASMAMTDQLTELLSRIPENVRAKAQLRLTLLVLAMDRIAQVVHYQKEDANRKAVLDEFAEMLFTCVFGLQSRSK